MNILAIDTSLAACSVAVLVGRDGNGRLYRRYQPMERGHAEALFPMIREAMAEAGIGFRELDRIAVCRGPGSFTGVRVGVAAARGFGLAADLPIVAATSLEIMAAGHVRSRHGSLGGAFMIAQDARRGEIYAQTFDAHGVARSAPAALSPVEALAILSGELDLVIGSGAAAVADAARRDGRHLRAARHDLLPDAQDLARLALSRPLEQAPPAPLYLRPPDAKPQEHHAIPRAFS
jgi:tRNA threonylcarbamoyladenosine biosynthesis protein TsaB